MKMKKLIRLCGSVAIAAAVAAVPIGSSVALAADNESTSDKTVSVNTYATLVDSGWCGAVNTTMVKWAYYDNKSLVISGSGTMMDFATLYSYTSNGSTSYYYDYAYDFYGDDYCGTDYWWYDDSGDENYSELLTSITVQSGIKSIGNLAFWNCSNLKSVSLPSTLTSIGDGAFYYCDSLSKITIPSSVESIGKVAFWNCAALEKITYKGDAPEFGDDVYLGTASTLVVYYPLANSTWTEKVRDDYGGTPTYVGYKGTQSITIKKSTFKKTLSAKKLKKKKTTFKVKATAKGNVTYTKVSGDSNIKINKNGKVTVKKGTPKGTYKVKVLVTAKATSKYKKNTKTTTLTVKVKK